MSQIKQEGPSKNYETTQMRRNHLSENYKKQGLGYGSIIGGMKGLSSKGKASNIGRKVGGGAKGAIAGSLVGLAAGASLDSFKNRVNEISKTAHVEAKHIINSCYMLKLAGREDVIDRLVANAINDMPINEATLVCPNCKEDTRPNLQGRCTHCMAIVGDLSELVKVETESDANKSDTYEDVWLKDPDRFPNDYNTSMTQEIIDSL